MSFLLSLIFRFNKIREQEGGAGSAQKWGWVGVVAQIMYAHVSKCKNDKKMQLQKTYMNQFSKILLIYTKDSLN
jgi:hypothetical protein